MKQHSLTQGSQEWLQLRSRFFTASEAPAMLGVSKYQTRQDLLKQKSTGLTPEVDSHTQRIFDKGHAAEASARDIAEEIIGEELYPVTGSEEVGDLNLLASFDGITLMEDTIWEHKLINQELRHVDAKTLPEQYKAQMTHQCLVSGAERCLFMASDGTKENCNWFFWEPTQEWKDRVIDGWAQFHLDYREYKPEPEAKPVSGEAPESLPTLRINLTGAVTASNLQDFKAQALARINAIKTDLQTDQDFADAEQTTKFLKAGEKKLEDAKKQALADTASIDDLFRTVDDLKEQMRQKRLTLEKLVKAEKENRRLAILQSGMEAWREWLDAQECPVAIDINPDIAGFMKGKKSIKGWEDAAADAVASAKIDARKEIERIKENYQGLKTQAGEYMFLFPDWAQLIQRDSEFLQLHIKQAIADHQELEKERIEAERERIRQQEEARIRSEERMRAESEAKAEAEAKARAEESRVREEEQNKAQEDTAMQCHSPGESEPGHRPALGESPLLQRASQIKQPEQVTISKAEYSRLLEAEALLEALKDNGVEKLDCWRKATEQFETA